MKSLVALALIATSIAVSAQETSRMKITRVNPNVYVADSGHTTWEDQITFITTQCDAPAAKTIVTFVLNKVNEEDENDPMYSGEIVFESETCSIVKMVTMFD